MSGSSRRPGESPSVEVELVPCLLCGRRFAPDRIGYHEKVCRAAQKEPREPYDSVAHRWEGTDNEPAIKWIKSKQSEPPPRELRTTAVDKNNLPFPKPAEDLPEPVAAVVQPDGRLQCPGCGRSFSEEAAGRHIPSCTARVKQRSSR